MFKSLKFATAAVLLSSQSAVAQTNGTLPNCTTADIELLTAIAQPLSVSLGTCIQTFFSQETVQARKAVCQTSYCVDALNNITSHDMPAEDCVQYTDQNPTNISNYQIILQNSLGNEDEFSAESKGIENTCVLYVDGVPSCRSNGHHPEINIRDMELLGNECYDELMTNGSSAAFESHCTEMYSYVDGSVWVDGVCSYGYYSNLEKAAQMVKTTKAGECLAANLTSFEAELHTIHMAENSTACVDPSWIITALNGTEGANCTVMGLPLMFSSWADAQNEEMCGATCSEGQLTEFSTMTSSILTGNYSTCVAEMAASPETACSDSSAVCTSVFAALENVTELDCNIGGKPAADANMTAGITEALDALNAACDAIASPASTVTAPMTNTLLAGLLVSFMMALF